MFRDQNEELQRLEALLLEEETDEQLLQENTGADETRRFGTVSDQDLDAYYKDYTQPYQIYNADTTDTDLDSYAEEVWQAKTARHTPLVALACILATGVLLAVLYLLLRYGGIL